MFMFIERKLFIIVLHGIGLNKFEFAKESYTRRLTQALLC